MFDGACWVLAGVSEIGAYYANGQARPKHFGDPPKRLQLQGFGGLSTYYTQGLESLDAPKLRESITEGGGRALERLLGASQGKPSSGALDRFRRVVSTRRERRRATNYRQARRCLSQHPCRTRPRPPFDVERDACRTSVHDGRCLLQHLTSRLGQWTSIVAHGQDGRPWSPVGPVLHPSRCLSHHPSATWMMSSGSWIMALLVQAPTCLSKHGQGPVLGGARRCLLQQLRRWVLGAPAGCREKPPAQWPRERL